MKSKNLPKHAVQIATYEGLREYAMAFANGKLNFLMVLGPAGVGKSTTLRHAMNGAAHWIEGNATPFGIYQEAFDHRNDPIVLDDVDALYRDRNGIRLLKSLCQSEQTKTVCWYSDSRSLERRGIPRRFTTVSPVAILANDWRSANPDVAALEDRAHVVFFWPPALEVHREVANWFWEQEIYDFVAQHLHLVEQPSQRLYRRAWEAKCAGLDWRGLILAGLLPEKSMLVAKIKADTHFATEEDRVQAFMAAGGGCRATYFNYARKLRSPADVPIIKLTNFPPQAPQIEPMDLLSLLKKRFGNLGQG